MDKEMKITHRPMVTSWVTTDKDCLARDILSRLTGASGQLADFEDRLESIAQGLLDSDPRVSADQAGEESGPPYGLLPRIDAAINDILLRLLRIETHIKRIESEVWGIDEQA